MKYYLDTEFVEGMQKTLFGETKPTIDLISVGLVSESGDEYYAISKDFNLKEAWNRCEIKLNEIPKEKIRQKGFSNFVANKQFQVTYWIRENVLIQIHYELAKQEMGFEYSFSEWKQIITTKEGGFYGNRHYKTLKKLIKKFGKTNRQIAEEIKDFCKPSHLKKLVVDRDFYWHEESYKDACERHKNGEEVKLKEHYFGLETPIQFYSYFGDYDWVVFCWLFGKMINLPINFPMYCIDLKQILDEKAINKNNEWGCNAIGFDMLNHVKTLPDYPKQTNEHNALADARWNKQLHQFLLNLK